MHISHCLWLLVTCLALPLDHTVAGSRFFHSLSPLPAMLTANLKSAFFLDIAFIVITTYISISAANELPLNHGPSHLREEMPEQSSHAQEAFFWQSNQVMLKSCLELLDISQPNEGHNYNRGVRIGAFDLMLNSGVLGITSEFMEKMCRK
ncbi:hypothetical protein CsSME_00035646 [Camellia sinensis var. sinensis]|uniref:Uncharacterized protein n=1 Tax=Camellia sinensis var. sinensis TaxID=542762 RepID=A0A4S4CWM5_CAMSN|nr:hypothetical protein TEA_023433 [Camellia sinensis var. sinensis]